MARGYQGRMMKVLGANDHLLRVTGAQDLTDTCRRVFFHSDTALDATVPGAGSWIRLWIPDPDDEQRQVQRGYTFVDADPDAGTFAIDFVLHQPLGPASSWATQATAGDTLAGAFYGATTFSPPSPAPAGYLLIGDAASLPALRSVVSAIDPLTPVEVLFEVHRNDDMALPMPIHDRLSIRFVAAGEPNAVADAIEQRDWSDWYVWAAAEKQAIKELKAVLSERHGFPKTAMKLAPYWIRGKPMGGKAGAGAQSTRPDDRPAQAPVVVPVVVPESASVEALAATEPDPETAGASAGWRSQAGNDLLSPIRTQLRVASLLQVVFTIAELVPYLLLVEAARRMLDGAEPGDLAGLAKVGLIVLGVSTTATALLSVWMHVVDAKFSTDIKRRLVDTLARLPLGWFDDRNAASVRARAVDDVAQLHYLVTHAQLDLIAAIVSPLVVLVYLFVVDARIAFILLIPLLAYGVVLARMTGTSTTQIPAVQRWSERISATSISSLEGASVIRTYGDSATGGLRSTLHDYARFVDGWQRPLATMKAFAAVLTRPATFLWLIALMATLLSVAGSLSASTLLTFLVLGVSFGPKLLGVAYGGAAFRESKAAAQRVGLTLAERTLQVVEAEGSVDSHSGSGAPSVRFDSVSFGYRTDHRVLEEFTLDLVPGGVTAIVGASGVGKSTLATLLARFHDVDAGAVLIDGRDVRSFEPDELYRTVGFVFQNPQLVHGSIAVNIALARPDATAAEIAAAAHAAHLGDRIASMPRGYDTVVGTEVRLSGGERQRLSIARTILCDPSVLVLDEATASADPVAERAVQRALSAVAKGRTVLVIAHRLHTIVDADRIVVLGAQGILQSGTHDELLALDGEYQQMWQTYSQEVGA